MTNKVEEVKEVEEEVKQKDSWGTKKTALSIMGTLFIAAIISSAKAIVDVQVLKAENINIKSMLNTAADDRKIIKADIKTLLARP